MKPEIVNYLENFGYVYPGWFARSGFHCAMYIGNNRFIEAAPYRLRPLRGEVIGVVISPFWKIRLWATNFTYGSVETSQKIRDDAVEWAKTQLGRPYQFDFWNPNPNPDDPLDQYSSHWYCSEIIWAAYWNQGVHLIVDHGEYSYNATSVGSLLAADNIILYENEAPIADAGGPYTGLVDELIYFYAFDSIDPDGSIMKYHWCFGDGNEQFRGYGYHQYSQPGTYTVTLTIKDNGGKYAHDLTTATITMRNQRPSDPVIIGETNGYVLERYNYSVYATDPDDDPIKYTIYWDDANSQSSGFLANGSMFNVSHQWKKPGLHTIRVTATDGEFVTETLLQVTIQDKPVDPEPWGSIIYTDRDGQGFFMLFILFLILCGTIVMLLVIKKRMT